jgi:hypothetical protein
MDREELAALRRQVEEDYKLDIAAIERLQRRYPDASGSTPSSTPSDSVPRTAYSSPREWAKAESRIETPDPLSPPSPPSASAERRNDDLEGSLRTLFSIGAK